MRKLLGLAALLCLVTLQSQAADEKKADKDPLEGTWDLVSMEFMGMKHDVPKGKEMSLTFKGGKVTKKEAGKKDEDGTYKLDNTKKPKEIDLTTPKDGKPNETEMMKAIYLIDGDTLKFAFGGPPGSPRPTAFDAKEIAIMTFKRKK
jgi:uncharacterized protein (TIGR03067 family)